MKEKRNKRKTNHRKRKLKIKKGKHQTTNKKMIPPH